MNNLDWPPFGVGKMKIKNFKSTESLYGVEPEYFENMMYFQAIEEKAKLAKKRINEINEKLDYRLPDNEYQELNEQLGLCEKAREFNEKLLDEYKWKKDKNGK